MIEMITEYIHNLFNHSAYAAHDKMNHYQEVINGSYKVNNTDINKPLCINGQATLGKGVSVQKDMLVNGRLISQYVDFQSDLAVNGNASIDNTTILGKANFRGSVEASESVLAKAVEILSDKAQFGHCKIDSILVKTLPRSVVQRIYLSNQSEITGDILFEDGKGEVYCDNTSKIHGKIVGGKLILS